VNTENIAQNYGKMKRPHKGTLDKKNITHSHSMKSTITQTLNTVTNQKGIQRSGILTDPLIMYHNIINVWSVLRPGQHSQYNDLLQVGRPRDQIPWEARFSAPIQTGPGAQPAYCTKGTRSLSQG